VFSVWFVKHPPFINVVLTTFTLWFPDPVPLLDSPFDKYSEYDPPGNDPNRFECVLLLFSAQRLLTGELARTFKSRDRLAQHSRLVCIQEIIRRYSRESSSPREQCSLLYYLSSPIQPTVCLLGLSSYSLCGMYLLKSILLILGHHYHCL
jgi:hypothetical protein